jgi:hypothetical protein
MLFMRTRISIGPITVLLAKFASYAKIDTSSKILAKHHIEQSWTALEFQQVRSSGSLRL